MEQNEQERERVEMVQKRILAREYLRTDYQSHADPHFLSFPAASFPLCKYSRTGRCVQPFSFIFFLFQGSTSAADVSVDY